MAELLVVLDVDGTLIDSAYHHALAWTRAFVDVGLEVPVWRVHRAVGMGGDRLVGAVTDEAVERQMGDRIRGLWSHHYDALFNEVRPLRGAAELVEELYARGHGPAIASSGSRRDTDRALDLLGIAHRVTDVVSGDDADSSKPDPEVISRASQHAGNRRVVVVGDTIYDAQAASRLQLTCIAVRTGGLSTAELRAAGADRVVDGPLELIGFDWKHIDGGAR